MVLFVRGTLSKRLLLADTYIRTRNKKRGSGMNIAVCGGSEKDREVLRRLLKDYDRHGSRTELSGKGTEAGGDRFMIKEYESGEVLSGNRAELAACSLVFLDIGKEGSGALQSIRQIKSLCPDLPVVLVTADLKRLPETVKECLDGVLRENKNRQTVRFSFVEGEVELKIEDIVYIETSRHKNLFYTKGKIYSIYKKLDEIEQILSGAGFVRIHRSFLVNMRYIDKISSYIMRLKDGRELSVPKTRYPQVKQIYRHYLEREVRL